MKRASICCGGTTAIRTLGAKRTSSYCGGEKTDESNKKVALVWYCKTAKGWRRLPVTLGANNRIKHGYVALDGLSTYCPEGRYEVRTYVNRKAVYKP